jgi:hypothetical protein
MTACDPRVRLYGASKGSVLACSRTDCTNFCTNFSSKLCEAANGLKTIASLFSMDYILGFNFAQLRLAIRLLTERL